MKFSTFTTIYILFASLIPSSISLVNMPGIPLVSLSRVYILFWAVMFLWFVVNKKRIRYDTLSYPFYKPMLLVMLSMLISTVFAEYFGPSVNALIAFILESFLVSLMIWVAYNQPQDIAYVMRKLVMVFVGLAVYGTISYITGINPVMDYVNENYASESRKLVFLYDDSERLGLIGRAQSIFSHPMQYGAFLVMILSISYFQYLKEIGIGKYVNFLYMAILAFGIIYTNSRAPLIFLLVTAAIYWFFQGVSNKLKIATVVLIGGALMLPFANDANIQLISSIFTEVAGGESGVKGSSTDMRLEQLSAAILLFSDAPIVGHGLAATRVMLENGTLPPTLLGAESFLFSLMIDAGLLGVLAHIYLYFFMTYYLFKQKKRDIAKYLMQLSLLTASLLLGYVAFILTTGVLDTFRFMLIIVILVSRYIYLVIQQDQNKNQILYTSVR